MTVYAYNFHNSMNLAIDNRLHLYKECENEFGITPYPQIGVIDGRLGIHELFVRSPGTMQSRPPQIREDFSEVQALKRCIRRRNSQVALILAVVLISLSACLMPQTSRDRFVGNNGSIQKNEYGQQKTSEWLFRESTLDAPFSFRSRLGRRYQGGGLMGKPVIDTHRGDSVFRRDRAGKVLAYRGGAAGDAAGANSSNARTSGRGRGGSFFLQENFDDVCYCKLRMEQRVWSSTLKAKIAQ
eukprot:jgi/Bigna1/128442/aug1.6_g3150